MINSSVPSWEFFNDNNLALLPPPSTYCSPPPESPMLGYGLSELTWVNGQLAMHGFDTAKHVSSTTTATTTVTNDDNNWHKPRSNGTLEAIVDQGHCKSAAGDHVPWFMARCASVPPAAIVAASAAAATIPNDARVPCSGSSQNLSSQVLGGTGGGQCMVATSTRVESCSAGPVDNRNGKNATKRAKLAAMAAAAAEYSSRDNSVSGTMDSQQVTVDTCDWDVDVQGGFTRNSLGSPGNTSSGDKTAADDRDSVGHSRPQRGPGNEKEKNKGAGGKASIATKRSRAAAVHNQSERKRRDKINDRMRTLQKLVPHASKTDKASMLDEIIEYLKNLQAQISMMSRLGLSPMNPMMMSMAMQQQMQMQMMSQMGMGMGMNPMGMGMMDMNTMGRPNVHPNPYMPMQQPHWDMTAATANAAGPNDRVLPVPTGPTLVPAHPGPPFLPDPVSPSLLAFQSQPMTLEGYSKMAAMFHQMNQMPSSGTKG